MRQSPNEKKQEEKKKMKSTKRFMSTKQLMLAVVFAALKIAMNMVFHSVSFGVLNFRVSNALLGTLPFTGWAGVLAFFISGLITNSTSPLGAIDMVSPFIGAFFNILIVLAAKTGKDKLVAAAMVIYGVGIGLWVGYMLNAVYGLPLLVLMAEVAVSNTIVSAVLAFPVYKAMDNIVSTHFGAHYLDLTGKEIRGKKSV